LWRKTNQQKTAMLTFTEQAARIRAFIESSSAGVKPAREFEREFNDLALGSFRLQYAHNDAYQRWCDRSATDPKQVAHWRDIPAVPTTAFKAAELSSVMPEQRVKVFCSSGTTGQTPSRHYHSAESLILYELSLKNWFNACFLRDTRDWTFIALTPSPRRAPESSLVHMFATVSRGAGRFIGTVTKDAWALDWEATKTALEESTRSNTPVALLGTAFNFVHLLDWLQEDGGKVKLPAGSRVLETGGYKGRSREVAKTDLHRMISENFGVAPEDVVCEYGMCELSSQAYNSVARQQVFKFPPWARAWAVSPETEAPTEAIGLLRIFDLANLWSVSAIQTEDLVQTSEDGFVLLGRATSAEPRGCSLQSLPDQR
jgi:hypothetical protein